MGLSADRMAAASSSLSFPWASIALRIVSLPLGQFPEASDAELDLPDRDLVQVAGPLLAIPGDERHRVALVEQLDDALHLNAPDLKILRNPAQVDLNRTVHGKGYLIGERRRHDGVRHLSGGRGTSARISPACRFPL